ncbi:MAG: N-acetylneuraminate synthase family protein [Phycisphaeraceae bacterium]|nr:N-acetylneuraminate synthase family protein [Phycisphaeraceae bacterium]MCB9848691.1 N-acetylneuraminate synthase family protein [Phycisphaeraceae bacterium]
MSEQVQIGNRSVGAGEPPYVIAEIGVNHDGSVERALELVEAARRAGADAVKLQRFDASLLLAKSAELAAYQRDAGESDAHAMLARLELDAAACALVVERAHALGLHAIVTVFNESLVRETAALGFDAWKTASPDIVHRPLIESLAEAGGPIIASTGAATMAEVERAVGWMTSAGAGHALLHCVSSYPTPLDAAHLGGIGALSDRFGCPVGYSDHTGSLETGAWAVAAGADILEKHLTWNTAAAGPDHAASLVWEDLAAYIERAHAAHRAMGARTKAPNAIELEVRRLARQSIVAARVIDEGEVITERDIAYKRPGGGYEPWRTAEVIGRRAAQRIEADHAFTDGDVR